MAPPAELGTNLFRVIEQHLVRCTGFPGALGEQRLGDLVDGASTVNDATPSDSHRNAGCNMGAIVIERGVALPGQAPDPYLVDMVIESRSPSYRAEVFGGSHSSPNPENRKRSLISRLPERRGEAYPQ